MSNHIQEEEEKELQQIERENRDSTLRELREGGRAVREHSEEKKMKEGDTEEESGSDVDSETMKMLTENWLRRQAETRDYRVNKEAEEVMRKDDERKQQRRKLMLVTTLRTLQHTGIKEHGYRMLPNGWAMAADVADMLYEKFYEFGSWNELKRMVDEEKDGEGNPLLEMIAMFGRIWVRARTQRGIDWERDRKIFKENRERKRKLHQETIERLERKPTKDEPEDEERKQRRTETEKETPGTMEAYVEEEEEGGRTGSSSQNTEN